MARQKTNMKKIQEGRCTGIGANYVPFYLASEAKSMGTASMIPDAFEGRMIHTLSTVETDFYWLLRWSDDTLHIREQYLLNHEHVNDVRMTLGLKRVSSNTCYTTDFLVDLVDGMQRAYSVKFKAADFDPNNIKYAGSKKKYATLIERQNIERLYWESQGIPFAIITSETINRTYSKNIAYAMGFYNRLLICNSEQKLMYLIAHKIIRVDMEHEKLNPKRLLEQLNIDVDALYEKALNNEVIGIE